MNKATPPPAWYAPWRAKPEDADDPADLGTCFGLDMSLDDEPQKFDAGASADTGASWVRRWVSRRHSAP